MKKIRIPKGKKAVLLDLDNTLYPYRPAHRAGLEAAFKLYARTVEPLARKQFLKAYGHARRIIHLRLKKQAVSHSRLLYFKEMVAQSRGRCEASKILAIEARYWRDYLKRMRRADWVLPFLRACRREKIKIVIVTNLTTEIQLRKIRTLGIARLIDDVVTSEEAGIEKPAPRIFHLALQKTGCRASEAVMIGDDAKQDRAGFVDFLKI